MGLNAMKCAALPANETERLEALRILDILDSVPEQSFDDLTLLAATLCDAPVALVSLVDADRQWFKSRYGLDMQQTHRDQAFCAHAILTPEQVMEVPDTELDERFADNPLVCSAPHIRFYAGAPLVTDEGFALGTLCILDHEPRRLQPRQRAALRALARQAVAQLKMRSMHHALQTALQEAHSYQMKLEKSQSRLRELNAQLHAQALTDSLTGVYNRHALKQQLSQSVAQAERAKTTLSVLLIDADHFKALNDSFGHQVGDDALRQLAQIIRRTVRKTDTVARYGGEEFVVIFPATDSTSARVLAERLRAEVQSTPWERRRLTISVGIVTREATHPRCTVDSLIEDADAALYRAKSAGRNRVMVAARPEC